METPPDPLIQTSWLAEELEAPDLRIVDIRGYVKKHDLGGGRQKAEYLSAREEYEKAHIPGAVYVDWTSDITDPENPVPAQLAPPERFAALMGSLGIGDDVHVVVYDHTGGQFATRLWWALMYYGHENISVLDGGWKKWVEENRPTTNEVPAPEPATFTPDPHPNLYADAGSTLVASQQGSAILLDARDRGQYTGEVARGSRGGRIPGATHLHADSLKDPETGTFRSREELTSLVEEAGVSKDTDEPVVAYCNGGVAATAALFTLYRLGYRNLANYDGSWNEWGEREDLPAES